MVRPRLEDPLLSISKPIRSAGAGEYYLRLAAVDDYYLESHGEPPGFWLGLGAKLLGLTGLLNKTEFRNLLRGRSPDGDRALVRNPTTHRRAGWDLTWSVPKSVSVIWSQADPEIRREIEAAVRCAASAGIQYVEDIGIVSRRGEDGIYRDKASLIFAAFEHSTSRAQDPQLHIHTLLMNVGIRPDGSTGTIDPQPLFKHQLTAGALFRTELAAQLYQRLGLRSVQIANTFEILGVSKAVIDRFSQRRKEIEAEMDRRGVSGPRAAEAVALDTRSTKQSLSRAQLFEDWRKVGQQLHWSTREVGWLVDRPPSKRNVDRDHRLAREQAVKSLTTHQSHFSERELTWAVAVASQAHAISAKAALNLTRELLQSPEVVPLGEYRREYQWTTWEVLALEQRVIDLAKTTATNEASISAKPVPPEHLSTEQREALDVVCSGVGGLAVVRGAAGSGKSTLFREANEFWHHQGLVAHGAALAGKAARGLQTATGIPSDTIHSTIRRIQTGDLVLDRRSVLIIDEAGMVGTRQYAELLTEVAKARCRLILAGDERQLQPIELGGAFARLARDHAVAVLNENHRQREAWAREAVTDLSEGRIARAFGAYTEHGCIHEHPDTDTARRALVNHWHQLVRSRPTEPPLVLATTNEEVLLLNAAIQAIQQKSKPTRSPRIPYPSVQIGEETFHLGEKILFTRNDRPLGIMNGETATLTGIASNRIHLRTDRGLEIEVEPRAYPHLRLGYALTIHKAQGITVDTALLLPGNRPTREITYVAASRARKQSEWYLSTPTVHVAMQASQTRCKQFASELLSTMDVPLQLVW